MRCATATTGSPRAGRSRARRAPRRSAAAGRRRVSDLRVIFSAASRLSLPTSSRISPSACCGRLFDLAPRLLEPPLAILLGLRADALALRRRRRAAPRRGSPPTRSWPGRSACDAPRAGARLLARAVGLFDRLLGSARGGRRSSSGSAPNAYRFSTKGRHAEADDRPDHQPRRDLDECVRRRACSALS